ncbi:MAG: LysM peptidoglycan-binding domain-containing protein [Chitinivibrionales bacterium]|nr:LysM peptidoglycan-binding domain-containing protein [Chitinivibrionales bacterium]
MLFALVVVLVLVLLFSGNRGKAVVTTPAVPTKRPHSTPLSPPHKPEPRTKPPDRTQPEVNKSERKLPAVSHTAVLPQRQEQSPRAAAKAEESAGRERPPDSARVPQRPPTSPDTREAQHGADSPGPASVIDITEEPERHTVALAATSTVRPDTYVVKHGDNLWNIAERLTGNPLNYSSIAANNAIGNPDLIYPGQVLAVRRRRDEYSSPLSHGRSRNPRRGAPFRSPGAWSRAVSNRPSPPPDHAC